MVIVCVTGDVITYISTQAFKYKYVVGLSNCLSNIVIYFSNVLIYLMFFHIFTYTPKLCLVIFYNKILLKSIMLDMNIQH